MKNHLDLADLIQIGADLSDDDLITLQSEIERTDAELKTAKALLRSLVCERFAVDTDKFGTDRYQRGDIQAKVEIKRNTAWDNAGLAEIEALHDANGVPLHQLIDYERKVSASILKRLDPHTLELINRCKTEKPGAPVITLKKES